MKIFDAHLHIIDQRFPLIPNQGYLPDYFSCADYLKSIDQLKVAGGVIVSGSFQGFDQSYLIDAIKTLGENFVGVTQLPPDTSDEDIIKLNESGVRALRFNINRGGLEIINEMEYFAKRVHELVNWHTELYIDSKQLPEITATVEKLPAVSIDHLGLSEAGLKNVLSLAAQGVRVKATGFGRLDFDPAKAIRSIYAVNPDALMFGTDLPSTRAERPFQLSDVDMIMNTLEETQAEKVLYKNTLEWYIK